MSAGYPANKRLCLLLTLTSQMPIPPSMPVVQNLVHWFLPPSSTEISLKYSLRQVKLCAHTHGGRSKTNLFKQRRWSCALLKYVKISRYCWVQVVHYYFTSCIFSPDLMLFLCRVFRSFSVLWVSEARRSRFWKRSLALMPFWAACLGTSSLPPNVKLPLAPSYTNSTG